MDKAFFTHLWFTLKDNSFWVYFKKYHDNTIIEIDSSKDEINYWGIVCESKTTSNFPQGENFVVLECVNRLLEKGYFWKDMVLEKTYKLGHINKWRLDILVKKDSKTFLMIECKTRGKEFDKELKNIQKDGWQIFSYFQQDRDTQFIMIYTSNEKWEYKNEIIKIEESYRETSNVKDFYDRWNKFTKQNGIFDDWVWAYNFESKALTLNDLQDIKESDASFIFNRFLEILRHNTVSDKWNAFNKIFTLFLCKIHDEWTKRNDEELDFQWKEWLDNHVIFQTRLTDLYKKWMMEFLSKEITDFNNDEFNKEFWYLEEHVRTKILDRLTKLRLQKNNEFAIKEVFDDETFEDNAVVLKEVVELLQNYKVRYTKKQPFLWDFFELLLTTWLKQEAGQFFTPVPIARFICKSIPIKELIDRKILYGDSKDLLPTTIDYAAGSGHFLTESMEEIQNYINLVDTSIQRPNVKKEFDKWKSIAFDWAYDYMYWIEKDYRLVKTAKVWCYLHGDGIATVIHGDGLDSFEFSKSYKEKLKKINPHDKQENAQFDFVLSNPPYSVSAFKWNLKSENAKNDFDLFESLTDNSSEIEALFIDRTKQLLKEGGIAWIVLPSSILSNTWIYTKAREIILKYFEIISLVSLGSNTFMATGTNTVVLFMRKRNKYFAHNLEKSIQDMYVNLVDISLNNIENVFSKYINYVWEWLSFEDYRSLILKTPNEKVLHHEIFQEYQNKLKLGKKTADERKKEFFEKVENTEKEKMLYFILSYNQNVVLVKSWEKQAEKEFLGYEFSFRKWSEWIHPIQWWKLINDCTKLFDPTILDNPEKVSTYIYDWFNGDFTRVISQNLSQHIFRTKLVDLLTFDRGDFEKTISTNIKKKISIWKYPNVKLWEICEVKIWWTPDRSNYEYWENWTNTWVSISEMNWNIITETKENITDAWVKKSNVKLINAWTTLLSFKLSIWKTAIAWKNLYTNEAIAWLCLENEEKVLNKYLFDLFNSKFIDLEKWWFNAFWKSLNSDFLRNEVKIPLPPKDIQQKIIDEIEILEKEESEKKRKVEELKSDIEKSIINSSRPEKLENISIMVKRGKSPKYGESNIQIIKSGQARGYKRFDFSEKHYVVEWFILDERKLERWDILINSTWVWTAWRVTLFDIDWDFVVDSHITILRLDLQKTIPNYVLYSLASIGFKEIEKMADGQSGQIELSLWTISNIKIPLPPLEIQKQIVDEIEKVEANIEVLEKDLKLIPDKKHEVLRKYL